MCYMDDVGVRELRQNLSKYLRRVAGGETLRVKDKGRPVALLSPLPGDGDVLERLTAVGRLRRAITDLTALGAPSPSAANMTITEALDQERTES